MSIYDKHKAHTARIGAYAIIHNGEYVAAITIAYPRDGAGRLYAYVHWIGNEMVRGHANGYGYDKRTAAVSVAARKWIADIKKPLPSDSSYVASNAFWNALVPDSGADWSDNLRKAGFTVCGVC